MTEDFGNGGKPMQTTPNSLRLAQAELHRTAHDQDLTEVPKRARLDREAEGAIQEAPMQNTSEQ
jgi:hypothetical protein